MEGNSKNIEIQEYDIEVLDSLRSISSYSDPIKIFSVSSTDIMAANNDFICIGSGKLLIICSSINEEAKKVSFDSVIKCLEINKSTNLISVQLESNNFIIFDLEVQKEVFEYTDSHSIISIKWNKWTKNSLSVYWAEGILEVWSSTQDSFSSTRLEIKDLLVFDFINPNKLVYYTTESNLKLVNVIENTLTTLEEKKEEKIDKIIALDEDKIALVCNESISIYSIGSTGVILFLSNKKNFDYDPYSDYLFISNTGSLQVMIITKENFLIQQYQDCVSYITLMEASNVVIIRKKDNKPQAIVRHADDIFYYYFKSEAPEEPLNEIKFDFSSPRPKKNSKKSPKESKFETKQINPKEIAAPIVATLTKNFDEIIRKIEKSLAPQTLSNLVNKTVQSTFDQKTEALNQKNLIQTTISQSLRYEFQNSLIPAIQQQLSDSFNKISVQFQESLKISSESNNKSAAKSSSLDVHMKAAIENISNATSKIEKEYASQLKKINEAEAKITKNFESRKQDEIIIQRVSDSRLDSLKLDIELKLRNHDFEGAVVGILKEKKPGFLHSVLDVMNPKVLCNSRFLTDPTTKQLFYELIDHIETENEFKDIYIWVEELGKSMNIPASEVSRLLVRLFDLSEKKPKMREVVKIFTMRLA
jgi:hypothetical protein